MILSLLSILKGSSLCLCVPLSSYLLSSWVVPPSLFPSLSESSPFRLRFWLTALYLPCSLLCSSSHSLSCALPHSSFSLNLSTHLTPTEEVYNLFNWSGWVLFRTGRVAEKFIYVFELKAGGFRQDIVFYFHFRAQDEVSLNSRVTYAVLRKSLKDSPAERALLPPVIWQWSLTWWRPFLQ